MSEILRGDHADLKDVLGPAMDTPRIGKVDEKKLSIGMVYQALKEESEENSKITA